MSKKELWKKVGIGAAKALLMALFIGAVVIAPGGVSGTLQVLGKMFEGKTIPDYDGEKIKRALRYLRGRRLIEIQKSYQKEVFVLTKLGMMRARKLARSFGVPKPKKWDSKWRLVIFDIPSNKKNTADLSAYAENHGRQAVDECGRRTLRSSKSEGGCFGGFRRRNQGIPRALARGGFISVPITAVGAGQSPKKYLGASLRVP